MNVFNLVFFLVSSCVMLTRCQWQTHYPLRVILIHPAVFGMTQMSLINSRKKDVLDEHEWARMNTNENEWNWI